MYPPTGRCRTADPHRRTFRAAPGPRGPATGGLGGSWGPASANSSSSASASRRCRNAASSNPRVLAPTTSAAMTDWESTIAADGCRSRPAPTRSASHSRPTSCCDRPRALHRSKKAYTVPQGAKSTGRARPVATRSRCAPHTRSRPPSPAARGPSAGPQHTDLRPRRPRPADARPPTGRRSGPRDRPAHDHGTATPDRYWQKRHPHGGQISASSWSAGTAQHLSATKNPPLVLGDTPGHDQTDTRASRSATHPPRYRHALRSSEPPTPAYHVSPTSPSIPTASTTLQFGTQLKGTPLAR
jgi:hypothetical protein